jgi:hypothetical protein
MSDELENTSEARKPERDEHGRLLPGNTANPNGRPPRFSLVALIERELRKRLDDTTDKTKAEKIVEEYIDKTLETIDGQAIRDLADRFDGKPTNKTEVTGANGEPITLKVEFVTTDESK